MAFRWRAASGEELKAAGGALSSGGSNMPRLSKLGKASARPAVLGVSGLAASKKAHHEERKKRASRRYQKNINVYASRSTKACTSCGS